MHDLLSLPDRQPRSLLVAFADIFGFTRHALRSDDAVIAEDLDDYYLRVERLVTAAGGVVVKYIGDSALIAFPEQAIDAGVECLLALKAETDAWLAERGWRGSTLNVKAHFGELVAGPFGPSGARRFDVIGKTVNIAARLPSPGVAITPQAFRKLGKAMRARFKKHTPPVTYIRVEDSHRD